MTNPDGPNLVCSETLERLRTAGFSEHEINDLLARARAATAAPPSPATLQPAAAPGQQAPMTGAISNVSTVLEQARRAIPAVQREAILQAQDPRGSDGSVGHWRRVASIIAWRTGQHSIVSAQR